MEIHEMKNKAYKRAEHISEKVIEMCTENEVTMQELELLKTALPIAINKKIAQKMYETKLS